MPRSRSLGFQLTRAQHQQLLELLPNRRASKSSVVRDALLDEIERLVTDGITLGPVPCEVPRRGALIHVTARIPPEIEPLLRRLVIHYRLSEAETARAALAVAHQQRATRGKAA